MRKHKLRMTFLFLIHAARSAMPPAGAQHAGVHNAWVMQQRAAMPHACSHACMRMPWRMAWQQECRVLPWLRASNHPYRDFLAQLPTASRRSLTQRVLLPSSGTYRDGAFNLAGATPLRFGPPAETHGQQRHACVHSLLLLRPWPPVDNTVAGSSSGCSRRRARRRAVGKTGPALYRAGRCAAVRAAARGMEIGSLGTRP